MLLYNTGLFAHAFCVLPLPRMLFLTTYAFWGGVWTGMGFSGMRRARDATHRNSAGAPRAAHALFCRARARCTRTYIAAWLCDTHTHARTFAPPHHIVCAVYRLGLSMVSSGAALYARTHHSRARTHAHILYTCMRRAHRALYHHTAIARGAAAAAAAARTTHTHVRMPRMTYFCTRCPSISIYSN